MQNIKVLVECHVSDQNHLLLNM